MRLLLLMLLPFLLSLFWLALRTYVTMRVSGRGRTIDATVTSARSSPLDADAGANEQRPPTDAAPRRASPCGRHNLHLFLRLMRSERGCRHCAAIKRTQRAAEAAAAIDAVEQSLRGERR